MNRHTKKTTGPDLFTARCPDCGELVVRTPSGLLSCPRGHGRLVYGMLALDDPPATAERTDEIAWF